MATNFLFKDPSKITFNPGFTPLTGNQLRGFGGFDSRIGIGNPYQTAGSNATSTFGAPGQRGIFFDGKQIGSTSDRNVQASPGTQGFSLFGEAAGGSTSGSTAANGAATFDDYGDYSDNAGIGRDNTTGGGGGGGALPDDAITFPGGTVVRPGVDGPDGPETDGSEIVERTAAGWFDPEVTDFVNKNFSAIFDSDAASAFRTLGTHPIAKIIMDPAQTPTREQWAEFTSLMEAEIEYERSITGRGRTTTGGGSSDGDGGSGTGNGDEAWWTGSDIGLPDFGELFPPSPGGDWRSPVERDPSGSIGDLGLADLQKLIDGLNFETFGPKLTTQRDAIGGLQTAGDRLRINKPFLDTVGNLQAQLGDNSGGILDLLGRVQRSTAPGELSGSLEKSQSILKDLIGGSFGSGPPITGKLTDALDQGGELDALLRGLTPPPNLGGADGPIAQAEELRDLFTLGRDQLTGLGSQADLLRTGEVAALGEDVNALSTQDLQDQITGLTKEGGTLQGLQTELGKLNIGTLERGLGSFQDQDIPDLQLKLDELGLGGLETKIADFTGSGAQGRQGGLENLQDLLAGLGIGGLEDAVGSFQAQDIPDFQDKLDELGLGGLEAKIADFTGSGAQGRQGGLEKLQDLLAGLGIGGLEDAIGSFTGPGGGFGTLEDKIGTLNKGDVLSGLGQELADLGGLIDPTGPLRTDLGAMGDAMGPINDLISSLGAGGLDPLSGIGPASMAAGPLNNLLEGIQGGDFESLQDLLRDAGANFQIPGIDNITELLGAEGIGGQLTDLSTKLPLETQKILDLIGKNSGGSGGGGATDLTGIEELLDQILAAQNQDTTGTTSAGGFMEELLDAIRPGMTDVRSQIQQTTAELIPQIRQQLIDADIAAGVVGRSPESYTEEATQMASAQASGILSGDPVTASILADQQYQNEQREKKDRALLQSFGVLRSGNTIDLANLRADDESRSRLAALGQGAERADQRFQSAATTGTTLAGQLQAKRLADAIQSGTMDGKRTLAGEQQDQALLAQIIALTDSAFNPFTTGDETQLKLVEGLIPLLPANMQKAIRDALAAARNK